MHCEFTKIPPEIEARLRALIKRFDYDPALLEPDCPTLCFYGVDSDAALAVSREEIAPRCGQRNSPLNIAVILGGSVEANKLLAAGYVDYVEPFRPPAELEARLTMLLASASRLALAQKTSRRLERFELASRGSQVGLWYAVWPRDHFESPDNYCWYSDHFRNLVGYTEEEFPNVTASWTKILHPDDKSRVWNALKEVARTGAPYNVSYRMRVGSGEWRYFQARGEAEFDESGALLNIAGNVRDIHEEKQTADKLTKSEAKYRTLIETAPDMILEVDRDSRIRFINRVNPGTSVEAIIGTKLTDYATEEDGKAFMERLESVFTTGEQTGFESLGFGPQGHIAWYASRLGPIRADGDTGDVVAVTVIVTDITARKNAELALRNEQKLLRRLLELHESDRQLFAYEIHDGLAQQIAGALMHLESFSHAWKEGRTADIADLDRGTSLVRESVSEARRLISGLRPPILDEQGIVAAIDFLAHEARRYVPNVEVTAHLEVARLTAPVEASIFRIAQEAINNAVRHSQTKRLRIELLQQGEHVRLHVRDWGVGFNVGEVREERFGLQGIRQRARLMGTKAVIDSAPGKGTSVTVDFSAIEPAPPIDADLTADER